MQGIPANIYLSSISCLIFFVLHITCSIWTTLACYSRESCFAINIQFGLRFRQEKTNPRLQARDKNGYHLETTNFALNFSCQQIYRLLSSGHQKQTPKYFLNIFKSFSVGLWWWSLLFLFYFYTFKFWLHAENQFVFLIYITILELFVIVNLKIVAISKKLYKRLLTLPILKRIG